MDYSAFLEVERQCLKEDADAYNFAVQLCCTVHRSSNRCGYGVDRLRMIVNEWARVGLVTLRVRICELSVGADLHGIRISTWRILP
jgi:hypothetical protein